MSTNKQRGLGKGLGAMFPSTAIADNELKLEIDIEKLIPNPHQPRKTFDEEKMQELVASVSQHGIIQPLIVREKNNLYEIVAGERRWRAAQKSQLKKVPVVIRNYTDEQIMEIALVENIQRHDLNPIEEAQAFRNLLESLDLTQEEVAQKVGRSRSAVANVLRMLNLPDKIQTYVSRGTLTMGQARPLLGVASEDTQLLIAEKIISDDMSAREVENYIRNLSKKSAKDTKKEKNLDLHLQEMQDNISLALGTQVQIKKNGNKGKILIDFYSQSDLERLLEVFLLTNCQMDEKVSKNFAI